MSVPAARVIAGDCRDVLATLESDSVQAVVTDPPYELGFMGRRWDSTGIANDVRMWAEVLRVMKPGAHLAAFGGTRTFHRTACAIEDAGFEIRDTLMWVYGSGFPKSHDVSKGIDKAAGAERVVVGSKLGIAGYSLADHGRTNRIYGDLHDPASECAITTAATLESAQWTGWGTALKPAWEPIILARKPLSEPTVARNVLVHACGALNVDACRIGTETRTNSSIPRSTRNGFVKGFVGGTETVVHAHGRWPANLIHDGSPDVEEAFAAFGNLRARGNISPTKRRRSNGVTGWGVGCDGAVDSGNSGSASRFFYCAKASKRDRAGSKHPTVKPLSLMTYLVKLVTPLGGVVLDPFAGSGTTLQAAMEAGFDAIGIEKEPEYVADIRARLARSLPLFAEAVA